MDKIIREPEKREVPGQYINLINDYFINREIFMENEEGRIRTAMQMGVPQGSMLGSLLWNIVYDGVLRNKLPPETKLIAFADDILITCKNKNIDALKANTEANIQVTNIWLEKTGLELAE